MTVVATDAVAVARAGDRLFSGVERMAGRIVLGTPDGDRASVSVAIVVGWVVLLVANVGIGNGGFEEGTPLGGSTGSKSEERLTTAIDPADAFVIGAGAAWDGVHQGLEVSMGTVAMAWCVEAPAGDVSVDEIFCSSKPPDVDSALAGTTCGLSSSFVHLESSLETLGRERGSFPPRITSVVVCMALSGSCDEVTRDSLDEVVMLIFRLLEVPFGTGVTTPGNGFTAVCFSIGMRGIC